jgi:hypothetical protein
MSVKLSGEDFRHRMCSVDVSPQAVSWKADRFGASDTAAPLAHYVRNL